MKRKSLKRIASVFTSLILALTVLCTAACQAPQQEAQPEKQQVTEQQVTEQQELQVTEQPKQQVTEQQESQSAEQQELQLAEQPEQLATEQQELQLTERPEQEEAKQQEILLPMSFEVNLTDKDVEDALAIIEELEGYIDSGDNSKIEAAVEAMNEKLDYIVHQYRVAEIKYYSDLEDEEAYNMYVSGEEGYMTVREESQRVKKKLYYSDLPAKEKVFEDLTEREIRALEFSGEEVMELERKQNELLREYLALENPESEEWIAEVEKIYFEYVECSQKLAAYNEYDNYYDYSATEHYMRQYSKEQRESFRENVKEILVPCYIEVNKLYQEKKEQLSEEQKEQFSSLRNDPCLQSDEYLTGYFDSYPEKMKTIMNNLFEREAVVYAESENSYYAGFTNYSDYCDQPYVFLGNGCQDMFTLVHELGHYVSFYHFEDRTLPYDTCEVHSQGNEWLMMQYLNGKIDSEVYETLLLWRLRYGLDTIILSTIIDDYEEEVFTRDKISSPEEFEAIMNEVLDGYENIEKVISLDDMYIYAQYATIEAPIYYLSYATSELVSMLFYSIAEEEGYEAAQEIYIRLCLETPTDNMFFDTLVDVGLPDPFERDTVISVIESFEAMLEDDIMCDAA